MAAPSFVAASTGATDAGGAWTATCHAPAAAGNLIILQVFQDGGTGTVSFTSATNIEDLDGVANQWSHGPGSTGNYAVGGTFVGRHRIWIGRATSTSAPTFVGGNDTSEDLYWRFYEFENVADGDLTAIVENDSAFPTSNRYTTSTGDSNTAADAAVTTTGPDRLALNFVAINDDNAISAFTGETGGDWELAVAPYADSGGTDGAIGLQIAYVGSPSNIGISALASLFGATGTNEEHAQSFLTSGAITVSSIDLRLYKTNTPSDNVIVEIQTDSGGKPSGTVVGSAGSVNGGDIVNGTWVRFPVSASLSAATTYWIVVRRDGARSTSDYVDVGGSTTSAYANGGFCTKASGVWGSVSSTNDLGFIVETTDGATIDGGSENHVDSDAWGVVGFALIGTTVESGDVTVTGARAFATAAGKAGAVRKDIQRTGVPAFATAAGHPGVATAKINASITGVRAFATASGHPGTTRKDFTVTGARAAAAAAGHPGTVRKDFKVTGVRAAAAAAGHLGTVSIVAGQVDATVTGARASATAAGHPGATRFDVQVTGVRASAAAAGKTGTARTDAQVTGARAQASAAGHPGTITATSGQIDATVTGERAFADAAGHQGTVRKDSQLDGARAFAGAAGHPGTITATTGQIDATVTGVRAFATADGRPGATRFDFQVAGARAQAAAAGHPGIARFDAQVTGVRAAATAAGKPGATRFDVQLTGVRAAAAAAATAGTTRFDSVTAGVRGFATAAGHPGSIAIGGSITVTGVRAFAIAAGHPGWGGAVATSRPSGVVTTGTWTPFPSGTLASTIDEDPPDDSDYDQSASSPVSDEMEVSLSALAGAGEGDRLIRIRYGKDNTAGDTLTLVVRLVQGADVLQTWTLSSVPDTPTTAVLPVTADITDYGDLRVRCEAVTPA